MADTEHVALEEGDCHANVALEFDHEELASVAGCFDVDLVVSVLVAVVVVAAGAAAAVAAAGAAAAAVVVVVKLQQVLHEWKLLQCGLLQGLLA